MPIDLITRKEWGARPPRGAYTYLASTKGVKVHYTGGSVDPDIVNDHGMCIRLMQSFQNQHMDSNRWIDLGYTAAACPHRKVFEGRGPHHVPAANGAGLNSAHYAVLALVGSSGFVKPNDGVLWGVLDAIAYLRSRGAAGNDLKGHKDGYSTSCPGEPLHAWVRKGCPAPTGDGKPATPTPAAKPAVKAPAARLLMYVKGRPMMHGDDVKAWQRTLRDGGHAVAVDGWYGEHTAAMTRAWQRTHKLPVDGIVGPDTRRKAAALAAR
ncbi:N-acetylmuramoyl-L-alanine amidase [Streptosporangium sp. NPDC000563]|uniref:peptidoglycan recognition protein family protein n=1 Tax=Streptosporangium sp. NPDC000563 TaxID=3154366 RepID=UPI0033281C63